MTIDFDVLIGDAEEAEDQVDQRAIEETILVGLIEPAVAPRILEAARPGDFYFDAHRAFAEVAFGIVAVGRHLDAVTFRAAAGDRLDAKVAALADLVFLTAQGNPPPAGKVVAYLDIFAADARRRLARGLIDRVGVELAKGDKTPEAAAGETLRIVADLEATRRLSGAAKTEGEELDAYFAALEAAQSPTHDFQGLDAGFSHLNRLINGLSPGLIVLGAMPSTGKTTFAKQIADQVVAKHTDAACLFVSLEQSKEELRIKTLSRLSGIENRDLQRGRLDTQSEAWGKVAEAAVAFGEFADRLQVLEGDRATTVERIRLAALQLRQKAQAARLLVVVDYLQIMPVEGDFGDARQKVNAVTSDLRRLGRDLDAPVIAIASVNRASYGDKGGKLEAFKESGDIEFSADVACILVDDKDKGKGEDNYLGAMRKWRRVFLDVVKNRNGERGRVELYFYPEVSRFREVSKSSLPED